MAKKMIIFALAVILSPRIWAQTSDATSKVNPGEALPDTEQELRRRQDADMRRLDDLEPALRQWSTVVARLDSAKAAIASAQPPDASAFEKLGGAFKAKQINEAKNQLGEILSRFQVLISAVNQAIPYSPDADPDLIAFNGTAQAKFSNIQNYSDINELFNLMNLTRAGMGSPSQNITPQIVDEVTSKFSVGKFNELKTKYAAAVDELFSQATAHKTSISTESKKLQSEMDDIAAKLSKAKNDINQLAIELGLPLFCATVLLMLIVPILVQSFSRHPNSAVQVRSIFASGILVEIITVLLLTMSVLILGLANRIQGEVLGTLLGGISGYVLNRFREKKSGGETGGEKAQAGETDATPEGT